MTLLIRTDLPNDAEELLRQMTGNNRRNKQDAELSPARASYAETRTMWRTDDQHAADADRLDGESPRESYVRGCSGMWKGSEQLRYEERYGAARPEPIDAHTDEVFVPRADHVDATEAPGRTALRTWAADAWRGAAHFGEPAAV